MLSLEKLQLSVVLIWSLMQLLIILFLPTFIPLLEGGMMSGD
jgi:hypothetical protein